MRRNLFWLAALGLVVLLGACSPNPPPATDGTWNQSNWDSGATWR
jgi:hypothetical protein